MQHFHEDRRCMFRFNSYTIKWNIQIISISSPLRHLNNVLLHLTAGRQALWTLLPRYRTKFWRSILSIPAILLPSTSGLKSCSAPRLPRFRLHGPPRRAGWRDWSTACRDVIALIRQVNGERSPIGIKFKPIPATSTNIIQAWQFWLPLHLPRVPLPSSPPCDWRNLKENEAAHEAIIYYA